MKATLEAALLKRWYPIKASKSASLILLKPFSYLFESIVTKRFARDRVKISVNDKRNIPAVIVVVGNITVGGTGKTPLIIALANTLRDRKIHVGILSRGHGGSYLKRGGAPKNVCINDDPDIVGDEPLLIMQALNARRSTEQIEIPLVVSKKRYEGLQFLLSKKSVEVVLSDDGLQHYALPRDLEYVVIDAQRGFGNGQLLPAGPLREPIARLEHVDRIIFNGSPDIERFASTDLTQALAHNKNKQVVAHMSLDNIRPLNTHAELQHPELQKQLKTIIAKYDEWHIFAGIGNPQRFFDAIEKIVSISNKNSVAALKSHPALFNHAFPDHHHYILSDITSITADINDKNRAALFTTEKDAVKLKPFIHLVTFPVYSIGQKVEWDQDLIEPILERLSAIQH